MLGLPGFIGTAIDLLTVIVGFGLIVFFHELGHFLAARWAGIRVLTFAVGFGPPVISWRRGVGLRRGSSRAEADRAIASGRAGVGQTEYRLSALPFGGYVQMLGQDDLDPGAVSDTGDSYQKAPVWKRMVVISAGVVMNVLLAGVLFIIVFMAGLKVEPPVIGIVREDSPAARAVAVNADALGVSEPGLRPGDAILEIDGHAPRRFDSVSLKVAMARAGRPIELSVSRGDLPEPLRFRITPEKSEFTGLLELGFGPTFSSSLRAPRDAAARARFNAELARLGPAGLEAGDRIVEAGGVAVASFHELDRAFRASGGRAVPLTVERAGGRVGLDARATPEMEGGDLIGEHTGLIRVEHLLGLVPVMRVADAGDAGQGLAHGDVFLRIGSVEFPSIAAGINEIRGRARGLVELVVAREDGAGGVEIVTLEAKVSKQGRVGFTPDDTLRTDTLLARTPPRVREVGTGSPVAMPAEALGARAGARLLSVGGEAVSDLGTIREALRKATAEARNAGADSATVEVVLEYPFAETPSPARAVRWTLDRGALDRLDALGWRSPVSAAFFEPAEIVMRAGGPVDAVAMGIAETHRVMMSVYMTFLRLSQGSLQVEHIKGPVGIAHIGTLIAERGLIWMLFFLGLISVNLAVVNFLPLPIVDGGQFLMLVYEQIRGRPVPIPVQNAVMTAGMLLIVSLFLIVTYNDIRALLGG